MINTRYRRKLSKNTKMPKPGTYPATIVRIEDDVDGYGEGCAFRVIYEVNVSEAETYDKFETYMNSSKNKRTTAFADWLQKSTGLGLGQLEEMIGVPLVVDLQWEMVYGEPHFTIVSKHLAQQEESV